MSSRPEAPVSPGESAVRPFKPNEIAPVKVTDRRTFARAIRHLIKRALSVGGVGERQSAQEQGLRGRLSQLFSYRPLIIHGEGDCYYDKERDQGLVTIPIREVNLTELPSRLGEAFEFSFGPDPSGLVLYLGYDSFDTEASPGQEMAFAPR